MKRSISLLLVCLFCCGLLLSSAAPAAMAQDEPDYTKKLSSYLLEYISDKPDDELIPVGIWLKDPSDEEIEALIPVDYPGDVSQEELNAFSPGELKDYREKLEAYYSAKRKVQENVLSALTSSFAERYLDDGDLLIYFGKFTPNLVVKVPKSKIAVLAALDAVTQINLAEGEDEPINPLTPEKADTSDKLSAELVAYMDEATDGELIPVGIWLKDPSDEEIEALIPVDYPGDVSQEELNAFSPEELKDYREQLEAYYSAKRKVQENVVSALTAAFTESYLDSGDLLIYLGKFTPNLVVKVPKSKITVLAALDAVTQINLAEGEDEPLNPLAPKDDETSEDLGDFILKEEKFPLQKMIAYAENIDRSEYTEESLAELDTALTAAKAAMDANTAVEVIAAKEALEAAITALEKVFRFDDVQDKGAFFYNPVYWAYNHDPQITKGVDDTHFGPDTSCTRGQVVTFLWRAAGCPEPTKTENPFGDVKKSAFYYKAVLWAVENGVTKGTSETTFTPDATCTRGQIVTFLYRAKGSPELTKKENPFKDVADGQFYAEAVAWAVENNVTKGKSADTFAPNATCTRGEVVTFLYRAMGEK